MKKILTIIGARPQFIKASVVSKAIQQTEELTEVLVHTGQHFDANMSDIFFNQLGIPRPDYQLDINGGSHGDMTGRMLIEIEKVLLKEKARLGAGVWRYQLNAGRCAGGGQAAYSGGTYRGGFTQLQYADAGGGQPYPH